MKFTGFIAIMVGLQFASLTSAAETCSGKPTFGSSYVFSDDAKNFSAATETCKGLGGHLVRLESKEENEYVKSIAREKKSIFLTDGTDEGTEEVWRWASNNEPFVFTDRFAKEPGSKIYINGKEEQCLTIWISYNYQWGDVPCDHTYRYICEIENQSCCCASQRK